MTIRKLMLSTAILAAMSGGVAAQTATETEEPLVPQTEDGTGMADGGAAMAPEFQSLEEMTVGDVLGTPVISGEGESVGEIDYVIMMGDGSPGAVIGIGGFLGLGEYTVALPLQDFTYDPEQASLVVGSTEEQLKSTPEFDESGVESLPDETPVSELLAQAEPAEPEADTDASDMNADAGGAAATDTMSEDTEMTAESGAAGVAEGAEDTSEEVAQAAEEGANEVEQAADEASQEMAEAADEAENAAENATDEVAQATEEAGDATESATDDMAQATDDAAESTETAGEDVAASTEESMTDDPAAGETEGQMAEGAAPKSLEEMSVSEAIGTRVQTDEGQDIGEINYVVMQSDKSLDAVVGVGGFLGVGEYDVALPIDDLTYDEQQKIFKVTMTEEELRQAPEYDEASASGAEKLSKDTIIGEAQSNN